MTQQRRLWAWTGVLEQMCAPAFTAARRGARACPSGDEWISARGPHTRGLGSAFGRQAVLATAWTGLGGSAP